jgi:hypothetical protein
MDLSRGLGDVYKRQVIVVAVVVKEPTTSVSRETLEYFLDIMYPYWIFTI